MPTSSSTPTPLAHTRETRSTAAALTLVSHPLCPYVQRAAIALREKGVTFDRVDIDLSNKPAWFLLISPLGKTPVLQVGDRAIFESAVIVEYLEDTQPHPLHPIDPLARAEHRAWIEFASAVLNDIAGFYNAPDALTLETKAATLRAKFQQLEAQLNGGPYFSGQTFSLVDAAFAPVFRYFDVFDTIADFGIFAGLPRIANWRQCLRARPSVIAAVGSDYPQRLRAFIAARNSRLSQLV